MAPTQPTPENTASEAATNAEERVSQLEQAKRELEAQLAEAKRAAQEKPVAAASPATEPTPPKNKTKIVCYDLWKYKIQKKHVLY